MERMKLFFSYGHDKHSEVVRSLAEKIKELDPSIDVWIDTYKIPRDCHWRNQITKGIIESHSVIAFLSNYSTREESVCKDELSIAISSKHGMIKTVLLEPIDSFTPPSILTEYQWGDMSNYPDYLHQGEMAFDKYIEAEAKKIIKLVKSDEIQQYHREIRELRKLLGLPETDVLTKFDKMLKSELVGRVWLLEKIKKWVEDSHGSQIMMLYGKPGAGKSMFTAHLQMYEPHITAAFPCDCRSSEFSSTDSIIRNIAYRLALRMPDYRSVLLNILRNMPNYSDENMLFNLLLATPLAKYNIDGNRGTYIIIVDALDEMQNDSLAKFIDAYAPLMKNYIRFLITSRKVPEITERFRSYAQIDMDIYTEDGEADLKAYYENRLGDALEKYPEKESFIQKLIEASDLMFAYAECVCNNILSDIAEGHFSIHEYPIPEGLNNLYQATLDRCFNSRYAQYTVREYEENWRDALGMIAASPEPLPVSTLKKLMDWGNNDLKRFCRPLSTLLFKTEDKLQIFHKSFIEWINTTEGIYASSTEDGIRNLAEKCYAIYKEDPEEMDPYMLLYTTRFCREAKRKKPYAVLKADDSYIKKVFDCADNFREMQHAYSYAMKFYEELLCVFEHANISECEGKQASRYGVIENRIGLCYENTNSFFKAFQYYQEDLEISKKLKDTYPANPSYLLGYSISLEKIARIYETQNQLAQALQYYQEALEISKQLKDTYPENPSYLWGYSISLNKVAGIYEAQNQLDQAFQYYQKDLEISKQLKDTYPENPDYLQGYSIFLERISRIYEAQNQLDQALQYYQEDLEISKQLKEAYPENPAYLRGYSISLERIAGIYKAQNQLDQALYYYQEETGIWSQLKKTYPENPAYLRGYSVSLEKIAGIYEAQNQLDQALQHYQEVLEIRKQLKDAYPENPDYLRGYSISLERISRIYEAQNQPDQALQHYQEAFEISKQLKDTYPENPDYLRDYSVSLNNIAGIYKVQKKLNQALQYYQEALEIRKQLKNIFPKISNYLLGYSISLEKVAEIYKIQKELDQALQYYQEALEIRKQLKDNYPENPDYLRGYYVSLNNIAGIHEAQNQLDQALRYLQKAVEILDELKEDYPQNSIYQRDYATSLNHVSMLINAINQHRSQEKYSTNQLEKKPEYLKIKMKRKPKK